ncbi:hypothetical protein [Clostridium butyricum]
MNLCCSLCSNLVSLKEVKRYGKLGVIIIYKCPCCKREYEDIGILKEK